MERQNVDYLLHVGSGEDEGRWIVPGAEARMVFLGGEGRNKYENGQGQPGQGAGAVGELSGDGPSAAAASPVGEGNQEGACGSDQENVQQLQKPGQHGMEDNEGVPKPMSARWTCTHPVRILVPGCRPRHHHRFTLPQLQELESAFQRNQYLSPAEAKRMAACMGVTEARVQVSKHRKSICNTEQLSLEEFSEASPCKVPAVQSYSTHIYNKAALIGDTMTVTSTLEEVSVSEGDSMTNMTGSKTAGNKVLPIGEERNKEDSGLGEPEWGSTATDGESEKELSEESHTAAATAGLVHDDMNKEGGGAGQGQDIEQQPNEPIPGVVEDERVQSVPRQVPRRRLRHRFTQWQLEELERIFQTNRFLSIEARKQLARWMGVNEARVKRWFQKRREQYRRYKRL